MAEWLGTGLQNRLQQFESARNLRKRLIQDIESVFFCVSSLTGLPSGVLYIFIKK